MSVLSVPRLFFKGRASWNPATGNNNDQWPLYDFTRAELNWEFLNDPAQQPPIGITPDNVREEFPAWARTLRWYQPVDDQGRPAPGWWQNPGEWGYFGGMEWCLHDTARPDDPGPGASTDTRFTGGQLEPGGPVITSDPLVHHPEDPDSGGIIDIVGDAFPHSTFHTPGRMVDNNPDAWWGSSFYLKRFQVGSRIAPQCHLSGDVAPGSSMNSRWLSLARNLNADGQLQIAGVGGAVLQACVPGDPKTLRIASGTSALLDALRAALAQRGVQGLMVRLTAYRTLYFTAAEFEHCDSISDPQERTTAQYRRLTELWDRELREGRTPTQNPCVSTVLGTVGLWHDGEKPTSAPGGRCLLPARMFQCAYEGRQEKRGTSPRGTALQGWCAPAVAETRHTRDAVYVSLDLGNTLPEIDSLGEKANLGDLRLVVRDGDGVVHAVGDLPFDAYRTSAYETTAGIVDIKAPAEVVPLLDTGTLELHHAPGGDPVALLTESTVTAETDQRSVYLDQGEPGTITVQIRERGAIPRRDVELVVQQYVPDPPQPCAEGGAWRKPDGGAYQEVLDLTTQTVTVSAGTGEATVSFRPVRSGCATVAFFPVERYGPGTPPAAIGPAPGTDDGSGVPYGISWASYACVRVLPFHDDLPRQFADCWNAGFSPQDAWDFLYRKVLYVHDVVYPVMKHYAHLDLGDKESVDRNIDQIVALAERDLLHSTLYMPVTRELSEGQRRVLKTYQGLVGKGWPAEKLGEWR
ncbi:hypothetical protein [Streptomyces sp. AN091965]|uniref:hypothetical protein n=1 Tax=Streptomyces sp. AN091965 TaxID=2927803 RepID=UPI001F621CB0|nr:hypothetical protein [Streptomyces sp. AN091965]MCI3934679.1 hypothetical protein [Streptomyces sp. AN091965]